MEKRSLKIFKKIYIEVTNICNLKCSFCPNDDLKKEEMSVENFEVIMKKINDYTDYIFLHVKGEPLMHSQIKTIINLCHKYNKNVNITTNGVLLNENIDILKNVREINISLQSLVSLDYLHDIFNAVDILSENTFIEYRLWTKNKFEEDIKKALLNKYGSLNNKLSNNVYLSIGKEFIWPNLDNNFIKTTGKCLGTKDQIGILVNGTIVPCCLDSKGIINLGNIFNTSIEEVINSIKFNNIKKGFDNNQLVEELCQKCGFNNN